MATHSLLLLPGDGIGIETIAEVERLIAFFNAKSNTAKFVLDRDLVGGSAFDAHGVAITDAAMAKAFKADAVIFGAVGGPKWDKVPFDARPEAGLLRLRKDLGLFANIRPAVTYPALADASSLKRELVEGLDIIILRELTGGREAYVAVHLSDLHKLGLMRPERLNVAYKDFPLKGGDVHGLSGMVKRWQADNKHTAYSVHGLSENLVRAYFLSDAKSSNTLLAQMLPLTTSNPLEFQALKLVYQQGGYWVYKVPPTKPSSS